MRVDLIRHGQVEGNRERRYVGSTDQPLTQEGRASAKEKAYPAVDHVFTSPLLRCLETAAILYPECEASTVPELAECDFGEFEYKNYMELSGNADYQAWIDSGGMIGFPGGEDRPTFQARCVRGFREAVRQAGKEGWERIALVVHGGTIMAILDEFSEPHADYFQWQCRNMEGYSGILDTEMMQEGIMLKNIIKYK